MERIRLFVGGILIVVMLGFLLNPAEARRHQEEEGDQFPNYNQIEYAKPLPPPDQQTASPKPGSIHMRVGEVTKVTAVPVEAIPVSILTPRADSDESEPPFSIDEVRSSSPTATN